MNHGVHVKLRLRKPNRDSDFYPFHQTLDTMLHELCHNAHGPHNAVFYKLWDDLRKVLFFLIMYFMFVFFLNYIDHEQVCYLPPTNHIVVVL